MSIKTGFKYSNIKMLLLLFLSQVKSRTRQEKRFWVTIVGRVHRNSTLAYF